MNAKRDNQPDKAGQKIEGAEQKKESGSNKLTLRGDQCHGDDAGGLGFRRSAAR